MHLVLGPHRFDLRVRTVLIAPSRDLTHLPPGADALWLDGDRAGLPGALPPAVPVGADAGGAADVARLADVGVAVVGVPEGDREALAEAARRRLGVFVPVGDLPAAMAALPPGRVLVEASRPVDGAVSCCSVDGDGPAAWGAATAALAAGVRVLRSPDARSMRRVATVADRLRAARHEVGRR